MDTPKATRNAAPAVPEYITAGVLLLGIVFLLGSVAWSADPNDFAEDLGELPAFVAEDATAEPVPGAVPQGYTLAEGAELPGPESITLDEFVFGYPEGQEYLPYWAAVFTNTDADRHVGFTLRLTFYSESGEELSREEPVGHTAATVLAPGESRVFGGNPYIDAGLDEQIDASAEPKVEILDPVWYTPGPEAVATPVTFESVGPETDGIGDYQYFQIEVGNALGTPYEQGIAAVFYDEDGGLVGGFCAQHLKGGRELPPGDSTIVLGLWVNDVPSGVDLAKTRFTPVEFGWDSC
ncbi:hypothetical protein [Glycomyces paridis]|uniref:Uncharacterized protein n=1 Tax=Glycomyces paridis TaxID=2126555 RepID=A0A4S8PAJ0_9ACTN|nr:hypothetical protein [Glycomyces paridis]THV27288.1 hypothetical protein E9998_15645 [Glycomyces paridis]